jgi:hypothetical protein
VSGLSARHFELYRLMWAKSWPSRSGRPVCKWGQAKLGAWLDPPIGARQVKRLVAELRAAGILDTRRQSSGGGYKGRGRGSNWNVLAIDPAQLDLLVSPQADSHIPWSPGGDIGQSGLLPGALEGTSTAMSPTRYVRSVVATEGGAVAERGERGSGGEGGEIQPAGSELQTAPRTNNGLRRWVPAEEFVPRRAREIAATQGVAAAERYLDAVRRDHDRRERMRAAGRHAQEVQAAEQPEGRELATGAYGKWLPAWAAADLPALAGSHRQVELTDAGEGGDHLRVVTGRARGEFALTSGQAVNE